jgi:hypothetical protein
MTTTESHTAPTEELEYGDGVHATCTYRPLSEWECSRCPSIDDDLAEYHTGEQLRDHDREHSEYFWPTDEHLSWLIDWDNGVDARLYDARCEATADDCRAKLREILTDAEPRSTGLLSDAISTRELQCEIESHRVDAAERVVGVFARYVGAGVCDLDVAADRARDVAHAAKLDAADAEMLVAQVRNADTEILEAWLAHYDRSAENDGHDLTADLIHQKMQARFDVLFDAQTRKRGSRDAMRRLESEARAEVDALLARIVPRDAFDWWSEPAYSIRRPNRRCKHVAIYPLDAGGTKDKMRVVCAMCGAGGSVLEMAERYTGHSRTTQPFELLDALKRDLFGAVAETDAIVDRIQSLSDFLDGPDPEYLIDDVMLLAMICVFFGLSGAGKSFLVIDQGLCVASGRPWRGHKVKRSKVLFVVGESAAGYRARIKAWCNRNGVDPASLDDWVEVLPCAVNLYDPNGDVGAFVQGVNDKDYDVIVFDTLSRMYGDGDDNSAHDFNVILNNTRGVSGMCWYVHHANKDGATYRGSGNIMAASDTMIQCVIDKDKVVTVSCFKQKEGEDFAPMRLQITAEGASAVLVPVASSAGVLRLNDSQRKVRDAVRAGAGTPKEIEFHSRLSKSTVTRTLKALMKMDVVAHDGSRYTIADTE